MMRRTANMLTLMLAACGAASDDEAKIQEIPDRFVNMAMEAEEAPMAPAPEPTGGAWGGEAEKDAPARKKGASGPQVIGGMDRGEGATAFDDDEVELAAAKPPADAGPDLRSWFPETFLWEPLVQTDASGQASLEVQVPDSLTTWRVLALAASREGAQAGDVYTFTSTLPVYVDPIVPQRLRVGDVLQLPVQVVNTTGEAVEARLQVTTAGLSGQASGQVSVPAYGTRVEKVQVTARAPGPATLTASLDGADAVRRELSVEPTGRKITESRSGLLGSEDAVELMSAPDAEFARARLVLFPGPLGVVRAELGVAASRMGADVGAQAFAYALSTDASALVQALGGDPAMADDEALRALRLRAQQALIRSTRAPAPHHAATALQAARRAPEDPIAERLATRMEFIVREAQLPDGTWAVPPGSSVQMMLARTAWIAGSTDDRGARVRASGAIERYAERLANPETGDAYTAALVLRSGLATEELRGQLIELIEGSVEEDGQGNARVKLPPGVQRADGGAPRPAEVEALCATVLTGDASKELAASLMSRYRPGYGFGDGYAGLAALEALEILAGGALPESMDVVLRLDGEEVERHTLRREAAAEVAVLTVPAPVGGSHRYEIVADGAWPGLAWHLDLDSWVPWEGGVGPRGLEVKLSHGPLTQGQTVTVDMVAAGPDAEALELTAELPVGFVVDERSLVGAELVSLDEQRLVVRREQGHGGVVEVRFQAVPTIAGQLSTGPTQVALVRDEDLLASAPPQRWEVR